MEPSLTWHHGLWRMPGELPGYAKCKIAEAVIIVALVVGIGVYHSRDEGKARVMKIQNTERPRGT